jgi:hypothetical protein
MKVAALTLVALAASFTFAADEKPKPAELLTKEESREVEAILSGMIKAGFPDTVKATVYAGKLKISATFDPKDPPLPSSASKTQMTNPNTMAMTYGYEFDGLHFKLADGSWLIGLLYHFTPKGGDRIDASAAPEVNLAGLTAAAQAAHPFNAEKDAAKYLDGIVVSQRPRARAEMDCFAPLTRFLKLRPDEIAPALVLLYRAGWTDAPAASLVIADQRARSYWQLKPWNTTEATFDPTGEYPGAKAEEEAWRKTHPQYESEAPQTALRRALFRWCRAQLMVESPEDALLSPAAAGAAAKLCIEPKDPQGNAARIDALLAGMKLPVTPAKNAGLAERLQSWEGHARRPRMVVNNPAQEAGGDGKSISIGTSFQAPVMAYTPQKSDLDALVALLGDERPSRFWDFSGPRTLGDNAWRAIAVLLKADPRTLAGIPTDKPWTAAECKSAAAAFQAWWKAHRAEQVDK